MFVYRVRLLLATSLAAASLLAGCGEKAPPKIQLPESRHDFGRFLERDSVQYSFVVENTGGDSLIIDRVIPGAGGGYTGFDRAIAPGGSGRVQVGYEGRAITGKFAKTWSIRSNDPARPDAQVTLTGEMVPYITVEPDRVYLSGAADEEPEAVCIVASHDLDPAFVIQSVESDIDDAVSCQFVPEGRPGIWRLRVAKNKDYRVAGSLPGTLTLHTSQPDRPERSIPVLVAVEPDIRVEPRAVQFGTIRRMGDTTRRTSIDVSSRKGGLEITGWKASSAQLSVQIETVDPGKHFKVLLTFTPSARDTTRQYVAHTLTLQTNNPDQPEIQVKVSAVIAPPDKDDEQ